MVGFNGCGPKAPKIYEPYLGRPGHYGCGGTSATGVLKEFNLMEGYMVVQPSIVGYGDKARIETDLPTIITIDQVSSLYFRPLREGDLEEIVERNNSKAGKSE